MNFSIDRDVLLNSLIHVQRGLPNKTPLPILYAIKFEVYSDYLQLTSSNSDIAIQVLIDDKSLKVQRTGKVALPGRYFIEIVRKINAQKIEVALQEERLLVIKADRSEFKLKLMDVEDYPDIDFLDLTEPIVLPSDMVNQIIKETNFATADNEKRPILTGVNFKLHEGKLYAVATDSYRLSQKNLTVRTSHQGFNIVIPNKSLDEISKILDHTEEDIEIYINPNKVLFKLNKILFQTRLLEGTYPDTFKIIPTAFQTVIQFNKEELLVAVDRVSLLSPRDRDTNYNIIKLTLRPDQVVEITSTNNEIGDAREEVIPTADVEGSLISIAFSSKYLNEALRAFQSSEITLNFAGDTRPFVIKGDNDEDLLHLILPVRID
jgi:DNA polymerase-3 subunit beta